MAASDKSARYEARELLMGMYFRSGQYKVAWKEGKQMLADRPDAAGVANMMATLEILKTYPGAESHRASTKTDANHHRSW